jgi:hypothetical protein
MLVRSRRSRQGAAVSICSPVHYVDRVAARRGAATVWRRDLDAKIPGGFLKKIKKRIQVLSGVIAERRSCHLCVVEGRVDGGGRRIRLD